MDFSWEETVVTVMRIVAYIVPAVTRAGVSCAIFVTLVNAPLVVTISFVVLLVVTVFVGGNHCGGIYRVV